MAQTASSGSSARGAASTQKVATYQNSSGSSSGSAEGVGSTRVAKTAQKSKVAPGGLGLTWESC